jgi:predicted  nucleic acid-binding Zn-ribbon protein
LPALLLLLWLLLRRLQRANEQLRSKDDEALELREQLGRLRDDFDELRSQHAALTAQGGGRNTQREMGVSRMAMVA